MTKNKVHRRQTGGKKTLCGVDRGLNYRNVVPMSGEDRDVTCKRCRKIMDRTC